MDILFYILACLALVGLGSTIRPLDANEFYEEGSKDCKENNNK